ncbi:hypothetical protein AVEN_13179-1 [Araneus ventricosus]|uniref:Uncharacterized protein n=1 Tax=Araneus ventricosus TaxID=182803 RepID=A0A4Y2VND6_ARAVE|nr:hypothetical protein AVEN_13179-1 [Araneus ventricosus]
MQNAQQQDPYIKPILEKKVNPVDRPSWQEIAPESTVSKRYWAVFESPYILRMVFYIGNGRVMMEALADGNEFSRRAEFMKF